MFDFKAHALKARSFAIYPPSLAQQYLLHLLIEEIGEVRSVFAKAIRDTGAQINTENLTKELGDVLWATSVLSLELDITPDLDDKETEEPLRNLVQRFVQIETSLCNKDSVDPLHFNSLLSSIETLAKEHLDLSLEKIAQINIQKLTDRQKRNVISGAGDHR